MQAQILALIRELQTRLEMAVIFVTHDLGVVAEIADEVAVMYGGRIIESGPVRGCFQSLRLVLDLMYETQTVPQRPYRRTVGHSASLTPASQAWRTAAHGGYT